MKDAFGHTEYGASQIDGRPGRGELSEPVGLAAKGAARANVPGTDQRHAMAFASTVDMDEAYRAGQKAVELAARGQSGFMATILGCPGPMYSVRYDQVPLAEVANSERTFPAALDRPEGYDVTDEFVRYARPLMGDDMVSLPMIDGRQRLARLRPI